MRRVDADADVPAGRLDALDELDEGGQVLRRDVRVDVLPGDPRDLGVLAEHGRGAHLVDDGLDDAALARHAVVVVVCGTRAGVPERLVAVHLHRPGLVERVGVGAVGGEGAIGNGGLAVVAAELDVDRHPAHGVDQLAEALEVDDDRVVDLEPEHLADDVADLRTAWGLVVGRIGAGVLGPEGVDLHPDRVEHAGVGGFLLLTGTVGNPVHATRPPGPELARLRQRDPLQVAWEGDEDGAARLGVRARDDHRVGPRPLAADAGIRAEEQDVDPRGVAPRVDVRLVDDLGTLARLEARGLEDDTDRVASDQRELGALVGGSAHHGDHERREDGERPSPRPVESSGPGLDRGRDDRRAPDQAAHSKDQSQDEQVTGVAGDDQPHLRHPASRGQDDHRGDAAEEGQQEEPAPGAAAGARQAGAREERPECGQAQGASEARGELTTQHPAAPARRGRPVRLVAHGVLSGMRAR